MSGFTIANLIRKNALSRGDGSRDAVIFGDVAYTYDELDLRTDQLAAGLQAAGVRKGDRVAVFSHNSLEFVELFFALAKLGGILVPVNYLNRAPEVSFVIENSGASWLVVDRAHLDTAREAVAQHPGMTLVVCGPGAIRPGEVDLDSLRSDAEFNVDEIVTVDDVLLLQYTSGTTGRPKAATHTHATVMNNALSQLVDMDIRADDIRLVTSALCWAAGFHSLTLPTWWRGGTVVLYPSGNLDPDQLCETIEKVGVTIMGMVPVVMRAVIGSGALDRYDISSLRMVLAGGEPCPVSLLDRLQEVVPGVNVLQVYGQSEGPVMMCALDAEHARSKVGSAGKPTSLTELRVVDSDGAIVPPGQDGEIEARSLATMIGYWNNPEETASTIVDQWLRTGDRGRVDEDGFLFLSGRSKEMIISGGLNVYPAEVERELSTHWAIEDVAVVGVPDARFGEVGCAHVVLKEGASVEEQELVAFCKERLAGYRVPRAWVFRETPLPRTSSNKVARGELRRAESIGG